jgi:hypothetical protein
VQDLPVTHLAEQVLVPRQLVIQVLGGEWVEPGISEHAQHAAKSSRGYP